MITVGIDLSSAPENTALCKIETDGVNVIVHAPLLGCDDATLDAHIQGSDYVAIDAPFGWPLPFVRNLNSWGISSWTTAGKADLRFRETDKQMKAITGRDPLSVSSSWLALPTMRTKTMFNRLSALNVGKGVYEEGSLWFCEVYPAASLKQWMSSSETAKGYKKSLTVRKRLVNCVENALPCLGNLSAYAATDHEFDALIAALTARAFALNMTKQPTTRDEICLSQEEGWIQLPDRNCLSLLFP